MLITRNQDDENAKVKDENQFLKSKKKVLTPDENAKEKSELNGLEGDFSFSDAGERKIDRQQGLVPGLQLSDQSPLVEIGAVDFTTAKNECKSSKVLSVEVKKKASIINAVQAFSVIEIRQRIQTLPTPQNSAKS